MADLEAQPSHPTKFLIPCFDSQFSSICPCCFDHKIVSSPKVPVNLALKKKEKRKKERKKKKKKKKKKRGEKKKKKKKEQDT